MKITSFKKQNTLFPQAEVERAIRNPMFLLYVVMITQNTKLLLIFGI